ncbi:MAG TPA: ABC-F family ATP-binding cassette domain-containing protein [Roseiflexaceae bacterium]|nr:ABC-F family ATP-binding cassette domain-containing protein [Roseiflexaceae bacterium]
MNILSLEAIHKQFADRPLLDDVILGIDAGERVGVVGVNGSGKTTLLRIVAGVEQPDRGRVSMARGLRVAYLPQNPALDPDLTVIEQIFRGEAPEIRLLRDYERAASALAHAPGDIALQQSVAELVARMDAAGTWALENDARTILTRLGIGELSARVGDLSGGQRKRVAMAAALIIPADLLILDEPTNHIDIETVAWLESFLARSAAALLLVTHDRYFLDRVVGRIVEVDNAKLYSYPGNYSRFLELKAERADKQASDEARRQTILRKELAWLRRGAQARTTKQQARIDRIATMQEAKPEQARGALEISAVSRRIGKRVIELAGVGKRFDSKVLVRDLTLSIGPHDRIGIVGPNGSGKTTLLNLIAGRLAPDSGTITIGETVHLSYYDQESAELDGSQRVIDYIKEGAELLQDGQGALVTAAQMLERFLFPSAAHYTPIARLSGGERRRLYLLRKLIGAPNVLLLDELTNDLDIQTLTLLEDYLDEPETRRDTGFAGAVIVVSHDRYFLDRTVTRLLAFEGDGAVAEYPGAYTAYAEAREQFESLKVESSKGKRGEQQASSPQPSNIPTGKPRKLTFKEARELDGLEGRIAALEAEQAALQTQINAASGEYQALLRLTAELERVSAELEAAVERWSTLAEIAESS